MACGSCFAWCLSISCACVFISVLCACCCSCHIPPVLGLEYICHMIPVCVLLAHHNAVTPVGFEPTPFRTGALSQRLRPLGQSVLVEGPTAMQPVLHSAMRAGRGMTFAPVRTISSLPWCRHVLFKSQIESGSTGCMLCWLPGCFLMLAWLPSCACSGRGPKYRVYGPVWPNG